MPLEKQMSKWIYCHKTSEWNLTLPSCCAATHYRCTLGIEQLLLALFASIKWSTSLFGISFTLQLHFLLLNFFFPHSTSQKGERYSSRSSCLCGRGQVSLSVPTGIYQFLVLSICLFIQSRELCKCCNSLPFFTKSPSFKKMYKHYWI